MVSELKSEKNSEDEKSLSEDLYINEQGKICHKSILYCSKCKKKLIGYVYFDKKEGWLCEECAWNL